MNIVHGTINKTKWEEFLTSRNDSTIYHHPGWSRFLVRTFDYEPFHIWAEDDVGNIMGFLPLFRVPNIRCGRELCSVPFAHQAGFIGDPAAMSEMLDAAIEVAKRITGGHITIREKREHGCLTVHGGFCTHVLELSGSLQETWGKLDRGSVRWAVNKARKMGVTVRESKNNEDVNAFYQLNCLTKKELGVPCHPQRFFKNLMTELPNNTKLYLSEFEGEIIGGGLFEYCGTKVIYGYGCADPARLQMHPYHAFIWKSIEDALVTGYRKFDFGRTSKDHYGLINFKSKWGTNVLDLFYSSERSSSLSLSRRGVGFNLASYGLRYMPMNMYKGISNTIFGLLG